MKKLYLAGISLLLIYFLHLPTVANAQTDPCNGDITLSSQAEVDAWPAVYGCSVPIGNLTISGPDITNIDSLYSITYVNGDLNIINNPLLQNLDGLHNCTGSVSMTVDSNPSLVDVEGLSAVIYSFETISITRNNALQHFDGLRNLPWIRVLRIIGNNALLDLDLSALTDVTDLTIGFNPSLQNIQGLRNLAVVRTALNISNNTSLQNLEGLNALARITGILNIDGNTSLANIDALSNLSDMSGSQNAALVIQNNPLITNLDALSKLTAVSGSLRSQVTIVNNQALSDVNGLAALKDIHGGLSSVLTVTDNPNLTMCCGLYQVVYNHSWNVGACEANNTCSTITIERNGPDCTENGILNNCIPEDQKCNGNIRLTTQEAVDAFPNRGCTVLTGSLLISGAWIEDLTPLSALVEVEDLSIHDNYILESLDGLENITKAKNIFLQSGDQLKDISMPGLTEVTGSLELATPAVTILDAFSSLTTIGKDFKIDYSGHLKGFDLPALTSIGGNLVLKNIVSLSNVDGFSNLTTIGGKLEIFNNDMLLNLDGFSSIESIGSDAGVSISITGNASLEWCCGVGRVLQDHLYSGSADISNNSASCTKEAVEAQGPCCPEGSELPADKFVFAENARGYAPHSTNIIVRDYEPGIMYELHNDADNSIVAGPQPGDVGLYASNIMETTTFNVLARNPETGCRNTMSTKPVVTILTHPDSTDCSSVPSLDKDLVAESDEVSPGGATNIIVIDYDEGVEYTLWNDADSMQVAGPWPGNVGLYTGSLNETTTFNVTATDEATGCIQQMSEKITISVSGNEAIVANVYPNPADGEFTVEWPDQVSETYQLSVTDFSGNVIRKEIVQKDEASFKKQLDLRPLRQGIYFLSIRGSNGAVVNKKLMIN